MVVSAAIVAAAVPASCCSYRSSCGCNWAGVQAAALSFKLLRS